MLEKTSFGTMVKEVPESRMARALPELTSVVDPESLKETLFRTTLKMAYTFLMGWTSRIWSSPLNLAVSIPPKRMLPVFESKSCW